jgi:transcriptional regulator with XRE-family HTH domain
MIKGNKARLNKEAILTLGRNVRKYRKIAGLTMMELAGKIDTDFSQVTRIERGLRNSTVSTIFDIAAALNVKPAQLLETDKEND